MGKARSRKPRALSLFSGAGGMDLGIAQAGFDTLLSLECDRHCFESLLLNAKGRPIWRADVRALDTSRLLGLLGLNGGDLDLLYGAPPSSRGSAGNRFGGTSVLNEAAVFELVRYAEGLRPTCVLIEQPPSALRSWVSKDKRVLGELYRRFEALGYDLQVELLDAGAQGLAQARMRSVVVAVPAGTSFELSLGSDRGHLTVDEALHGLPAPVLRGTEPTIANHFDATPPRARERIAPVPEGAWLSKQRQLPVELRGKLTPRDTTKFRRLAWNVPAPTLFAGEIFFHPIEDRYITPREAARLQGFPDSYRFEGPIGRRTSAQASFDQHRQVAEATPPPFAAALARKIREILI